MASVSSQHYKDGPDTWSCQRFCHRVGTLVQTYTSFLSIKLGSRITFLCGILGNMSAGSLGWKMLGISKLKIIFKLINIRRIAIEQIYIVANTFLAFPDFKYHRSEVRNRQWIIHLITWKCSFWTGVELMRVPWKTCFFKFCVCNISCWASKLKNSCPYLLKTPSFIGGRDVDLKVLILGSQDIAKSRFEKRFFF